jgi:hypothetical protein
MIGIVAVALLLPVLGASVVVLAFTTWLGNQSKGVSHA